MKTNILILVLIGVGAIGTQIAGLHAWSDITPLFVGGLIANVANTVVAYLMKSPSSVSKDAQSQQQV